MPQSVPSALGPLGSLLQEPQAELGALPMRAPVSPADPNYCALLG